MKLLSVILPLIILSSLCYSQQFIFKRSFGEFENASSFYINSAGIVYVTDNTTDEVYQVDTLGNELAFIGGYGWETYTFDDPVDVFADPPQVIVTDKNNHRIKRFDKNLNFSMYFNVFFLVIPLDIPLVADIFWFMIIPSTTNLLGLNNN